MSLAQAVPALNARLESWLASLRAIPTPEVPERRQPERKRKRRRIPIRRMSDQAEREFIKNLRKQMLERARREIEAAKKKVAALKRHLGEFTDADALRWFFRGYGGLGGSVSGKDLARARSAYRDYIKRQITYWEGFARMNPRALAQQYLERFL